jgi:DNA helicase II / ATP-dependent DNA helicase PcrA
VISAQQLNRVLGLPQPTDEQAAVIEAALEPNVVIAGAGAGKTETMATRVVWLVANRLVTPDAVLGLTFTRKAAAELGKRIRRRLGQWRAAVERDCPDDLEHLTVLRSGEPTVSTYAAYAGRLVSEQALRLGAEPDARLMSPAMCWQLADRVMRAHDGELPEDIGAPGSVVQYLLQLAGQFADHLVAADDVDRWCAKVAEVIAALPGRRTRTGAVADLVKSLDHRRALLPLAREYAEAKAATKLADFGDQMELAARVAELDEVRASERARYRAVLLDEYQDTGHAQVVMLHGLFGAGHPVTAVGDPFQSIYGWRGASSGNIVAFDARFRRHDGTPARVFPLATSFRNDRAILTVANTVCEPLRGRTTTAPLRPGPDARDGEVRIAFTQTHREEAAWVADRMRTAWDAQPAGGRTAAVLVRRRAQIPVLADALRAAGLPVEIVGLGGLLTTPEVADVVATLRVLADIGAGSSLARLLTGARWRIGPRDLKALRQRARYLATSGQDQATEPPAEPAKKDDVGLIEALDDLGPERYYSPTGYQRLSALAHELRRLRRRTSGSLPELVAEVERTSGLDVEVLARPDGTSVGRVHLDRFLDEAARFVDDAGDASQATLSAFLAFLNAAETEEYGLEAGEVEVAPERVQILTGHGAKGLEWDVVAVPGLSGKLFPAEPKGTNWAKTRHLMPGPLRGDSAELPAFGVESVADTADLAALLKEHDAAVKAQHAAEERRLAYVAVTRARRILLASGYAFDEARGARPPSEFLAELRERVVPDAWDEPAADAVNPIAAEVAEACWPVDPLRSRAVVEAGAALVRAAMQTPPKPQQLLLGEPSGRAEQWADEVDALLAERHQLAGADAFAVALPTQLSVSQLVELRRDPAELARAIRRPLPRRPAPLARRGTAFHRYLEQRWGDQALLDLEELPGAADDGADDRDFTQLRDAFERSAWAQRTPEQVEVPFEMTIDGRVIRGRMDAVFRDGPGEWLVIDWKTGAQPAGAAADAAAVQLAAYRLAWARLSGIPDEQLHRVRAAFHYVRSNETVEPTRLLDAAGLRALLDIVER